MEPSFQHFACRVRTPIVPTPQAEPRDAMRRPDQSQRPSGFCFHSQMIQSTFFGSPPKSLRRVMH